MKRWEQKELVQSLRREGFSYHEIIQRIPFSLARSTMSHWCKDIELTSKQLDRLDRLRGESWYRNRLKGSKTTQRRRAEEVAAIKAKARAEVPDLSQKELWVAGLMLYWAEGCKSHAVGVSNSDAALVKFMVWWLKTFCGFPERRFRLQLHLHSGQNEQEMKAFWSDVTGIPLSQFQKSFVKREGSGHRKKRLYYGTIAVRVSDSNCLHRILGWIEGFTCQFASVAQLGEQLALNEKVPSSILGGGTRILNDRTK